MGEEGLKFLLIFLAIISNFEYEFTIRRQEAGGRSNLDAFKSVALNDWVGFIPQTKVFIHNYFLLPSPRNQ